MNDKQKREDDERKSENNLAFLLPAAMSLLLVISYFTGIGPAALSQLGDSLKLGSAELTLPVLLSMSVVFLFVRSEIEAFLVTKIPLDKWKEKESDQLSHRMTSIVLAAALIFTAYSQTAASNLWAVHNVVNVLLSVKVARLLQFNRLPPLILALLGLIAYDVFFVLGTDGLTESGRSIMAEVAQNRLDLASTPIAVMPQVEGLKQDVYAVANAMNSLKAWSWRPGLLEMVVKNRVTDALGLADVIFPSLFAIWCKRYDELGRKNHDSPLTAPSKKGHGSGKSAYFNSSIAGYIVGILLSDLFPISREGQPALLYIIPSMFALVFFKAIYRQDVGKLWNFDALEEWKERLD